MGNVVSYLLTPASALTGVCLVLAAAGGALAFRRKLGGPARTLLFACMLAAIGLVLWATVLREMPGWVVGVSQTGATPPATWGDLGVSRFLRGELTTEVLLNVALFVPAGFFGTVFSRRPGLVAVACLVLSIVTELAQGVLGLGACDLLDLLANTLGALAGCWLGALAMLLGHSAGTWRARLARLALLLIVALVASGVMVGASYAGGLARQELAAQRLQELYAGTNLATSRQDQLADTPEFRRYWDEMGQPVEDVYADETHAVRRDTWHFYLATTCVLARWDRAGFTTELAVGSECARTLS